MHIAVRPHAATGVALLSAGVIAMSPLAPPMPAVQAAERALTSANVELAAAVDPIRLWIQVFQTAAANLGAIGEQITANPTPILSQVIANQVASFTAWGASLQSSAQTLDLIFQGAPAALQTALGQLQDRNIVGAVDTLNNNIVVPLVLAAVQVVSDSLHPAVNTVQNFASVFATLPDDVFAAVLPMTYPLLSAVNAIVATTQDVADGIAAGDAGAVVNALVNAPANLVGGVLNGAGSVLGFLPASGILTPYSPDFGFLASGPLSSLIALRETIAEALGATPPTAAASNAATSAVATVPAATKTIDLAVPAADAVDPTAAPAKAPSSKGKPAVTATASATAIESSTAAADSTSTGRSNASSDSSDSSDSPTRSGVTEAHDSAKPGPARSSGGSSAKAGKSRSADKQQ